MADAAQGALSKLFVRAGTGSGLDYSSPSAEAYEFVSESLQATRAVLDTRGIRGTRSMPYSRARYGLRTINGEILMHPSPLDLDNWLPRIMGAAEAANVFDLGDTFSKFGVYIDRVTNRFSYIGCLVSRTTFRCQAGSMMEMSVELVGGDEELVSAPSSAPTLSTAAASAPYVFHDAVGAVNLPSISAAEIFDMELTIDNVMAARFVNAVTTTSIVPSDRVVSLGVTVPYDSDHDQAYRLGDSVTPGTTGLPGDITFTNGSYSLKFEFASLDGPQISPIVQGKQEVALRFDYIARSSGDCKEVLITNVSA